MKTLVLGILASDLVWPIVLAIAKRTKSVSLAEKVFQRVLYERIDRKRDWVSTFIRKNIPDLSVSSGPLRGMTYPQLESAGSMLSPKLLGTYESEIADFFDPPNLAKYRNVVDVGCAEGFYAVGIARANPDCQVYAYDVEQSAQALCQNLAEKNGVADRVHIGGLCSESELIARAGNETLVVSDCEGAEMDLFSPSVIAALAGSDLMIEVHEHLGADLNVMLARFEPTHDCRVVRCVMDLERLGSYHHRLVDGLPDSQRVMLFAECRTRANCWLIATSKHV